MKPAVDVLQAFLHAERRAILHRWVTDQMAAGVDSPSPAFALTEPAVPALVGYSSEFLDSFVEDVGTGSWHHAQSWLSQLIGESLLGEITATSLAQFVITLKTALGQLWVREAWNRHSTPGPDAQRAVAIVELTAMLDCIGGLDAILIKALAELERHRAADAAFDIDSLELYEERKRAAEQTRSDVHRLLDSLELLDSIDRLDSVELAPPAQPAAGGLRNMAAHLREASQAAAADDAVRAAVSAATGDASLALPLTEAQRAQLSPVGDDVAQVNLAALVRRLGDEHGPQAARKGVSLSIEVLEEPLELSTRRISLQALLGNLLATAVAESSSGLVTLAAGRSEEGRLWVEVADQGPGLPEAVCQWLQGASDGDIPEQGLGMLIVRDLVVRLGAELEVANRPLGGTRYQLTL